MQLIHRMLTKMYLDGGTMILLLLMVSSFAVAMAQESSQAETVSELEQPLGQVGGIELGSRAEVFLADGQVGTSETETEEILGDVTPTEEDQDINGEDLPTPEELRRRRNRRPNGNGRPQVRPVPLLRVGPIRESAANSVPVFSTGLGHRLPPNRGSSAVFKQYAEEEVSPNRQSSGSVQFSSGSLPDRKPMRQSSGSVQFGSGSLPDRKPMRQYSGSVQFGSGSLPDRKPMRQSPGSVQFSSGSLPDRGKPPQSVKPPALLPHDIYTSSLNNIQQEKLPEVTDTEQDEDQLRRDFHEYLSSHRIDGDKDMLTEESRLFGSLFPNYNRLWNDFRSLRRPGGVQGRHSYGGNSRLNNHSGKVRFPNKNYIEPPHHRDYQYPDEHHRYRQYPDELSPITTTTQQTTAKDIFSIHNMAGPPYYDSIPANITLKDYITTTTTTSRPTTLRPTTRRPTTRRPTTRRPTTRRPTKLRPTTRRPTTRRPTTRRPTTRRPTTRRPTTTYYEYTTKRPQQTTTSRSFDVWTPFTFQPNYPNIKSDFDFGWGTKINNSKDRSVDKKLTTTKTHYTTVPSFTPSQRDFVTPGFNTDYFTPKKPNIFTTEKSYYSSRAPEYKPDYKSDYDYSNNHRLSMDDEKYLPSNKPKLIPDFPQVRTENKKETHYERERNVHAYTKFKNIRDHGMSENYNKHKEKNRQHKEDVFENNQGINSYRNDFRGNTYKTDINEKKTINSGNSINFPQIKPKRPIKPKPKQRYVPNARIHNQGILSKPSMVHNPVRKPPARNPSGRRPAVRMQKFRAPPAAVRHVVANPWILQKDDYEVVGYPGYDPQVLTKTTSILTENRPQRRPQGASQIPRRQQGNNQNRQRLPSQLQIPRRQAGYMIQGKVSPHQLPSVNVRRREPPRRNFFGLG